MKATFLEIDSEVIGGTVVAFEDIQEDEPIEREERILAATHRPHYAICKLPLDRVQTIQRLEDLGFRFLETQLRLRARLSKSFAVEAFPYRFERVLSDGELEPVLAIAGSTFTEDRFSCDPWIPASASGLRYRRFVERSLRAPDERVFRLVSEASGEVVAFKTHRITGPREAQLLLGGVKTQYKAAGLGAMSEYFELNLLREQGVRSLVTHVSAKNYPVINLEVSGLGFRVETAFAVLRKVYSRTATCAL